MKTCEACGSGPENAADDMHGYKLQGEPDAPTCMRCWRGSTVHEMGVRIRANRAAKARSEEPGSHWLCGCYRGPDKLKDYSCGLNTCDRTAGDRLAAKAKQEGPRDADGLPFEIGAEYEGKSGRYTFRAKIGRVEPTKIWACWDGYRAETWIEPGGCRRITPQPGGGSGDAAHGDTAGEAPSDAGNTNSPQPPPGPAPSETRTMQSGPENTATYVTKRHGTTAPPGPAPYELFRAAVEKHLVPLLPKGFRVVTDQSHGKDTLWHLWITDDEGRQVNKAHWAAAERPFITDQTWRAVADNAILGWAQLRTGMKEVPRRKRCVL